MKKKVNSIRFALTFIGLLLLIFTLTACSHQKSASHSNNKTDNKTVALVTDNNTINDHSYNYSAWQGLKQYGENNHLIQGNNGYQYFVTTSTTKAAIQTAINKNFKTIFSIGPNLKTDISQAAKDNPHHNFVIIDGTISHQKNVASINFNNEQAAYLAGIVAAYTTKTNTIGFIGGEQNKATLNYQTGFELGIKAGAKKLHKNINFLNSYTDSFSKTAKAKELTLNLINKKADIIFQASGKSGTGVFQAVKLTNEAQPVNNKVFVIGVDTNQQQLGNYYAKGQQASNFTLTSVVKAMDQAVANVAQDSLKGNFPGGKNLTYNLQNNGVYITNSPNISNKAWDAAQKARLKIINGKIKIPSTKNAAP
ncbi:BMP family lipoprotein [Lactobacillus sp. PV034]|uniref:BMP family lipoprotein n=1 Tax=Lactobacillus sp. PV034 TaxID=2594495 RepID=UPI00223FBC47|nr:BMP family ABC transporter substrate-binding protein [Lactobacillus sp. PV034]QNQ81186.1 BMP family ABC transporter substrate-binding protein [Lactobacillus sp. PV034]